MNQGDAAELVVRMSLQGAEITLRLTGAAAKNIAALLYAIYKDQKQTKGKTKLEKMLKSGKPLKVFSVKQDELKFFQQVAKRYGILYALLIDKRHQDKDGMVDFMVRAEDAARINRIINRYKFSTYQETDVEHDKPKNVQKDRDDEAVDDILSKPSKKKVKSDEEIIEEIFSDSSKKDNRKDLKKNQSELSSKSKKNSENGTKKKESVRKKLKDIKTDIKNNHSDVVKGKEKKENER